MTLHLIALGANSCDTRAGNARNVARAGHALAHLFGPAFAMSNLFATPAWPPGLGPEFVNAAACLRAEIDPHALLQILHRLERRFGRVRRERWGNRALDLDLLASGSRILPDVATSSWWRNLALADQRQAAPDRLILPHPRLQDRGFVLVPLAEVAPAWRHPLLGSNVAKMAAALPRNVRAGIRPLRFP